MDVFESNTAHDKKFFKSSKLFVNFKPVHKSLLTKRPEPQRVILVCVGGPQLVDDRAHLGVGGKEDEPHVVGEVEHGLVGGHRGDGVHGDAHEDAPGDLHVFSSVGSAVIESDAHLLRRALHEVTSIQSTFLDDGRKF